MASGASISFATPHKERFVSPPKRAPDNFIDCVIRRTVNGFYITDKKRPVLKKIHAKLVQSIAFTGRLSTLRKVLMRLGFRWTNQRVIDEFSWNTITSDEDIAFKEHSEYRSEGRPIHPHQPVSFGCSDDFISVLLALDGSL
jgi:hypothetical protein